MWLLVVEVIAAIIASIRGHGAKPFILLGGTMLLGVFLTMVFGSSAIGLLQIIDIGVTLALVVMALVGKKKDTPILEVESRIKCPKCAEWIMQEAKV